LIHFGLTFFSLSAVYAIQAAGLAIGIGIGSSFIVLVSFIWGIFVFHEQVHSRLGASIAILCMMLGLLGMSYFSSPESEASSELMTPVRVHDEDDDDEHELEFAVSGGGGDDDDDDANQSRESPNNKTAITISGARQRSDIAVRYQGLAHVRNSIASTDDDIAGITSIVRADADDTFSGNEPNGISLAIHNESDTVVVLGRKLSRRHVGMLSAMFTGCYGGSIMAPMKYAPPNAKGTHFLISFAIGSALVNTALWVLRYLYYLHQSSSPAIAWERLPSFHLRDMWKPGVACGLLCKYLLWNRELECH
jgi:hypothetical protein